MNVELRGSFVGGLRYCQRTIGFLLILLAAFLLASCGGSDETPAPGNTITSGTIGGMAFTVVSGTVTQDAANGPITAGSGEAAIVFDDTFTTMFGGATTEVGILITSTIPNGGKVGALAFGSLSDEFTGALATFMMLNGSNYDYGMFWGINGSPGHSGTFAPVSSSPAPLLAGFGNNNTPANLAIWHPDEGTGLVLNTCASPPPAPVADRVDGGAVDNGNGDSAGIIFDLATISDVVITDQAAMYCF